MKSKIPFACSFHNSRFLLYFSFSPAAAEVDLFLFQPLDYPSYSSTVGAAADLAKQFLFLPKLFVDFKKHWEFIHRSKVYQKFSFR